jgi:hypothetical protein
MGRIENKKRFSAFANRKTLQTTPAKNHAAVRRPA